MFNCILLFHHKMRLPPSSLSLAIIVHHSSSSFGSALDHSTLEVEPWLISHGLLISSLWIDVGGCYGNGRVAQFLRSYNTGFTVTWSEETTMPRKRIISRRALTKLGWLGDPMRFTGQGMKTLVTL